MVWNGKHVILYNAGRLRRLPLGFCLVPPYVLILGRCGAFRFFAVFRPGYTACTCVCPTTCSYRYDAVLFFLTREDSRRIVVSHTNSRFTVQELR